MSSGVAAADMERRQKAIADIEGEGFIQQDFTSSRNNVGSLFFEICFEVFQCKVKLHIDNLEPCLNNKTV